jgi:hypothetical protein
MVSTKISATLIVIIITAASLGTYGYMSSGAANSLGITPTPSTQPPTPTSTQTTQPTNQPTTQPTTPTPTTNPTTNPTTTEPAETTMNPYWASYSDYDPPTIRGYLFSGCDPVTRISIGVPNKTITLYCQAEDGTWSSLNETTTNSNGQFTFTFDRTTLLMGKTLKASFDGDANYQATSAIVGPSWY